MTGRRGVSAAEKYAELEASGLERPQCECHGKTMGWQKDPKMIPGGRWICAETYRSRQRKYFKENRETKRERDRLYYAANREKIKARVRAYRRDNYERVLVADRRRAPDRSRRWRMANPEKVALINSRRVFAGKAYLGTCGFTQTEVEAMLNGASD